ncbi:MAG: flagellar filament capping protein FliD, partial [Candidatus Saccharibacteria bacterium]
FAGGEALTLTINGTGPVAVALTTTAATATYNPNNDTEMSQLAANLQADINADPSFGAGAVSVTWDSTNERLVFTDGKAGASNTISIADDAVSTMLKLNSAAIPAATAGTNASVTSVFTPDTGSQVTTTLTDTTTAGTASNMTNLLKRINGDTTLDAGHTAAGGQGPLMNGVTLAASSGLTAGTATINTSRGNELSTQLATYATYVGDSDIGTTTINCAQTLNSAGFRTAPSSATNGYFTINGKQITIANYQSVTVNEVLAMINGSGAGVTASYDSTNDRFVLTANQKGGDQAINVGSETDTSDFLNIIKIGYGGTYTQGYDDGKVNADTDLLSSGMSKTVTAGTFSINGVSIYVDPASDSLNTIIERINNSSAGVTASFNETADVLEIVSKGDETGTDSITIGSATDTSNFWWATNMVYPPLIDDNDDILETTYTVGSPGQGSKVTVDGTDYTRRSNSIDDIINGVTLNLQSVSTTPVTIDITSNTDQALAKMVTFLVEYNKTVEMASAKALTEDERKKELPALTDSQKASMTADDISIYEANRQALLNRDILHKDNMVRSYYSNIRMAASAVVPGLDKGYNSLSAIGIDTGMWGSTAGSNPHGMLLTESTDKTEIEDALKNNSAFMNALQSNPDKVYKLLSQLTESTVSITGNKTLTTINLSQQIDFMINDGTNTATVSVPAAVYTGANIANMINRSLTSAGISTIGAVVDSSNHLKLTANTGDTGKKQALMNITDLSNGLLLSVFGLQAGLYQGVTVQSLTGLARREYDETKNLTSVTGSLNARIKDGGLIDQNLQTVNDSISSAEDRLTNLRTRLHRQFTSLETYMSQKNSQSTWLSQQIANLGGGTSSGGGSS